MNRLDLGLAIFVSRASTRNMARPAATNPRLPSVLIGSRINPSPTRSHQREISPMACSLTASVHQPPAPPTMKKTAKMPSAVTAMIVGRYGDLMVGCYFDWAPWGGV
jgi:hypothetical protein